MTQTHHAQLKNKTISFFIRFIENSSRVNNQSVDFFNKTSQDRNALQQLKKNENQKRIYRFAHIDANKTTTIAFLFALRRVSTIFINMILRLQYDLT